MALLGPPLPSLSLVSTPGSPGRWWSRCLSEVWWVATVSVPESEAHTVPPGIRGACQAEGPPSQAHIQDSQGRGRFSRLPGPGTTTGRDQQGSPRSWVPDSVLTRDFGSSFQGLDSHHPFQAAPDS